ncbi:MAG: DNA replication/repair protein RecF [Gammaproteobacteria bacterium]|nr:DNA replication/repair protein RecF [Gammaproteobacteria bacterium]
MIIQELRIENLRNLGSAQLQPNARLNVLYGDNGAGKTSVLEALVVLSRGRSFRTTQAGELVGPRQATFQIFADARNEQGRVHKMGLERSGKRWRGRMDGEDLQQLSHLTRSLPLVLLEPESHLLISGSPETRRRFIDWGMFHVEPSFLDVWRRYSKALKQRNAALRQGQAGVLDSLDAVLCEEGEALSRLRASHAAAISNRITPLLERMSFRLGDISIEYHPGWGAETLKESLGRNRTRDLDRGLTLSGPHRADLRLSCGRSPARAILSRGEQKMLATALLLTQAEILSGLGEPPLVLLDDLGSEFDREHFGKALSRALEVGGQVWLTGTARPSLESDHGVFHVEQGAVRKMV